jgi:acyl-CoA thioester hydrolase
VGRTERITGVSPFTHRCSLRWSDVDSYGHVNNVQTLRLLEEARVALLFVEAAKDGITGFDGDLVVVRHEIDYRRPLLYRPEPLTIDIWVTTVRASSVSLAYVVRDEAATYAEAASVLAAYDQQAERPRRLTVEERRWLERFADPPPQRE